MPITIPSTNLHAFGRAIKVDEPDRGTTHYVNDGFGDMLSSMDAIGRVITFGVDALGRTNPRELKKDQRCRIAFQCVNSFRRSTTRPSKHSCTEP
jgi:hypothetical protein